MSYVSEYWRNAQKNALRAKLHTAKVSRYFQEHILSCIQKSIIYDPVFSSKGELGIIEHDIQLVNEDSVSAIFNHSYGKTAILNFASYKEPGGGFLAGSVAQEECLCHSSILYNVLSSFKGSYYAWNNEHKNKALYLNRAIYTPDIPFFKDGAILECDVITCAAPNKHAAQKYLKVSDEENLSILESRIKFVIDIASHNRVKTLILGAYGCGVFGQDPKEVATIFKDCINKYLSNDIKVIFAIPKSTKNDNLIKFTEVFNDEK